MKPIVPLLFLSLSALAVTTLAGCGTQFGKDIKVQADLTEAQREGVIGQTQQARVWADRAIAEDPGALSTYLPTDSTAQDALSIADIFGDFWNPSTSKVGVGDEATLRDYMKQAVAKFPNDYRPLQLLEETYGILGDTTDQQATATALAALLEKKITTPGTHDTELTEALAQAYCDAGNLTKGVQNYQAVIRTSPNDIDAYNGLAYAWAVADSQPDLPQARADAQQALTLAIKTNAPPEGIGAIQDTLGWVQYRQGDYKDALDNIQAAVNADPREAEERYHLGMVYEALHQPDSAQVEFHHAVLLAQGYAAPQRELSHLPEAAPTQTAAAGQ